MAIPEGIFSLLDTDLYKLTMQSAVLRCFPKVQVTYTLTNRTPDMKLNRAAFEWLETQIHRLENVRITKDELGFLRDKCPYLSASYLAFLESFRLRPREQVLASFRSDGGNDHAGDLSIEVKGSWLETILYEIPLLALVSEAYFRFIDIDWNNDNQLERARDKGLVLLQNGCNFSEFGSRRRRDYRTHDLVMQGLCEAQKKAASAGYSGVFSGTSNVHFAMKYNIPAIGTVAHEWFMAVAAVTDDYANASEIALNYWIGTFGKGVLSIALTDTFGTPTFLKAFRKTISPKGGATEINGNETFAQIFNGVRQDSGDPLEFIETMRQFYIEEGVEPKTIVFSDSLNVNRCLEYKKAAEAAGFKPTFGIGTHFTNDFNRASSGAKSVPLNIVIKLSSADEAPAVKIGDNEGKNTGDAATVSAVKHALGYDERSWVNGDESKRWDT